MAQSLISVCHNMAGYSLGVRFLSNAVSTFGRNELVRWAKGHEATHILWVDTDLMFPEDACRQLLNSGHPFVGANYALKDGSGRSACSGLDGQRLTPKDSGVEDVGVIGFGLTLTDMKVIDAVGDPWFKCEEDVVGGPGDEVRFCLRAIEAGYTPRVLHSLSRQCRHVGFAEYELP
jgi:hypothetical protein